MLEIFQFDFMIRAFIAGITISIVAPLIGMFLVVRRYSLMADTLAHVSLLGVAVGLLTNIPPFLTSLISSVIAAFGIERLRESKKLFGESILALFLSGSLAIAVLLISLARGFNVNLFSYLFGSISTVSIVDLYFIIGLGALVIIVIFTLYKEFFLVSLDEELALSGGLPARLINLILVILAAVSVSIAIRVVGVLLVGALMVIPVITAMQYAKSFRITMVLSVVFSFFSVIIGLFSSYYLDLASGGTIVVVALLFFIVSLLFQKR